jgi:hypothetical protein
VLGIDIGIDILGQADMDRSRTFQTAGCALLLVHTTSFMSLPSTGRNIQTLKTNMKFSLKPNIVTSRLDISPEHCYIKTVDISPEHCYIKT